MIGKKTSLLTYIEPHSYHKYREFQEILKHELNELKIKREEKTKMGNGETFDVALVQKIKKNRLPLTKSKIYKKRVITIEIKFRYNMVIYEEEKTAVTCNHINLHKQ